MTETHNHPRWARIFANVVAAGVIIFFVWLFWTGWPLLVAAYYDGALFRTLLVSVVTPIVIGLWRLVRGR